MDDINLIPAQRLLSKRRKRHLRIWVMICGAYCTSLSVAMLSARAFCRGDSGAAAEKLQSTEQCVQQYNSATERLQKELADASAALEINKVLRGQPDWSKLLVLLSSELGDEVVLSSCQLISVDKASENITDHLQQWLLSSPLGALLVEQRHRLNVSGFGRTQSSVSQFVLGLERAQIFDSVRLIDSNRQAFLNGEAVAFSIECQF